MGRAKVKTYTARYVREAGAWVVTFDEVELSTYGRTLAAARRHARDALALVLELEVDQLAARVNLVDVVPDASGAVADAVTLRREAEHATAAASAATRAAVANLRGQGWSLADVADVLDISPQAVSKLERTRAA